MVSDWHGARVSKIYKGNFDDIFRKKAMAAIPTIEGTNSQMRYINRQRHCPDCRAGLFKGPVYTYCQNCLYRVKNG